MDLQRAQAIALLCEHLNNPTPGEQAAIVLAREVEALQAYAAEMERTRTTGGIPQGYTSPSVLRGYVTGERL